MILMLKYSRLDMARDREGSDGTGNNNIGGGGGGGTSARNSTVIQQVRIPLSNNNASNIQTSANNLSRPTSAFRNEGSSSPLQPLPQPIVTIPSASTPNRNRGRTTSPLNPPNNMTRSVSQDPPPYTSMANLNINDDERNERRG